MPFSSDSTVSIIGGGVATVGRCRFLGCACFVLSLLWVNALLVTGLSWTSRWCPGWSWWRPPVMTSFSRNYTGSALGCASASANPCRALILVIFSSLYSVMSWVWSTSFSPLSPLWRRCLIRRGATTLLTTSVVRTTLLSLSVQFESDPKSILSLASR